MSSNVGLSTPRGSGTSGYVQRNLSLLKPRDAGIGVPYSLDASARSQAPPKQRKPDQEILAHKRLRDIEVAVCELEGELAEQGATEETIEEQTNALRAKLIKEMDSGSNSANRKKGAGAGGRLLKNYEVHERAELKERESEKLRRALGLKGDEVRDDGEHPMARQEKRRRERELLDERKAEAEVKEDNYEDEDGYGDADEKETKEHSRCR